MDSEPSVVQETSLKSSIRELKLQLDTLRSMPRYITGGEENFSGFFKSVVTSIINTIGHVINLFKTNLFKSYLSLKRTELRYYTESNLATVRAIKTLKYIDVAGVVVPYPTGMKMKYREAIATVGTSLVACDIVTRSKIAVNKTTDILRCLMKGTQLSSNLVDSLTVLDPSNLRKSGVAATAVLDNSVKVAVDKTFDKLFVSMEDMKHCEASLLDLEKYVLQVSLAHKNMAKCHDNFTAIIKQVEAGIGTTVSKDDVEKLASIAYYVAETFDIFSSTVTVYHVLEHNFVELYKELDRLLA